MCDLVLAQFNHNQVSPGLRNPDECPHCGDAMGDLSYLSGLNHISNCEGATEVRPSLAGLGRGIADFSKKVMNF